MSTAWKVFIVVAGSGAILAGITSGMALVGMVRARAAAK